MLVIDQSGSMKKNQTNSSVSAMDGVKALAKKIVDKFYLSSADLAARFSVVSFSDTATIRVAWSTDDGDIDAAIDAISPDGDTSISAGLNLAQELIEDARDTATKVVLLLSDGEQDDSLGGSEKAIAAAQNLSKVTDKVFAWGFGPMVDSETLEAIAGDDSRVRYTDDVSDLFEFLTSLAAYVCNDPPPSLPPPPSPPPPSPPPPLPSPPPPSPSPPPPSPSPPPPSP